MLSKAKYRGVRPMFGVERGKQYTMELRTYSSEHGQPYLWVRIQELPDYLMPYESMLALLQEWDFSAECETPYIDHLELVDKWLDIYDPEEVATRA